MRKQTKIWTTKDGRQKEIKNMETSHIKNALNMLLEKGFISHETLSFYLTCEPPNGDMANYAFEQELDNVLKSPTNLFIDYFEEELIKRKSNK